MAAISQAELSDLPALIHLEVELFSSDCISPRQFRYLLTKASGFTLKLEENKKISGYMILLKRKNCSHLRLYSIGVSKESRKRGYGRLLLEFAEKLALDNQCSRLTLEVCEQNSHALHFYQLAGYSQYGIKQEYYEDGCTALLLHKKLI